MLDIRAAHTDAFSAVNGCSVKNSPGLLGNWPYLLAAQSPIELNPYYSDDHNVPIMRLGSQSSSCGVTNSNFFTATALHEARHAWQANQIVKGGRGGGGSYYVNDQDGDGLVLAGTTSDGSLTIIDSTNSRTVCNEDTQVISSKSYLGPTTADLSADVDLAFEYDAWLAAKP